MTDMKLVEPSNDREALSVSADIAIEIGALQKARTESMAETRRINKAIDTKVEDLQRIVLRHEGRGQDLPLFQGSQEPHDGKAAAAGE